MALHTSTEKDAPALGYLQGQWYFTGPDRRAIARVVETTDSDAKVALYRLAEAGMAASAARVDSGKAWVPGGTVRHQVDLTREVLGQPTLNWADVTREFAGVTPEAAAGLPVERYHLNKDRFAVQVDPELTTGAQDILDDVATPTEGVSVGRAGLSPYDAPALSLLRKLDRLLGEFEDTVRIDGDAERASQFLERLQRSGVREQRGYTGALEKAIKEPTPDHIQEAFLAGVGVCMMDVRSSRRITGMDDITVEMGESLAEPEREIQHIAPPLDLGHEQGDLDTGEYNRPAPKKKGRPVYYLTQKEIPDQDAVFLAEALFGTTMPGLTTKDARKMLGKRLKVEEYALKARGILTERAKQRKDGLEGLK
ncbi:MAG: hypothetical protein ACYCZN_15470 [Candidatus Dormibacteria bacterium]